MKVRRQHRQPLKSPRKLLAAGSHEFELKLQVPAEAQQAIRDALGALPDARSQPLIARYFDTAAGELAAAGLTLRVRCEDGRWMQTVKREQGAGAIDRVEQEAALADAAAQSQPPSPDLKLHANSEVGTAISDALGSGAAMEQQFVVDVVRLQAQLREQGTLIDVALDIGTVQTGVQKVEISELEFELVEGRPEHLAAVAAKWTATHGLWMQPLSKAERGHRLVIERATSPVVKAEPAVMDRASLPDAVARAVLRSALAQVLPNVGAVASGEQDAEHVHQSRVGLRRLRTALKEFASVSRHVHEEWEPALATAFRALGEYRDQQAVMEALRPRLLEAGVDDLGWTESDAPTPDPVATVRDSALQATLLKIVGTAHGRPDRAGDPGELRAGLRQRLSGLHRRVRKDGRRFDRLSTTAQHDTRKRLKRLRYLTEFVAPLFNEKRVGRYLKGLKPAQDALGAHNDDVVALELAREAGKAGDQAARDAAKWLRKELRHSERDSQRMLKKLKGKPAVWSR